MKEKNCISCGMPMRKPEDFAMSDETKDFCSHCCDNNGDINSFEVQLEKMTKFIIKTQGFTEEKSKEMAKNLMKKQPAWQTFV